MDNSLTNKLGIIAGGGRLPSVLVKACEQQGRPFALVALEGEADNELLSLKPDLIIRVGRASQCFRMFKDNGVASVVMAGKVHRPTLMRLRPDFRTLKFLMRTGTRAFTDNNAVGDDRLLRAVIKEIESEGLKVVSVADVLTDLLVKPGVLGQHQPTAHDYESIDVGIRAAKDLGAADIGQAVVVQTGRVLEQEQEDGTNALIQRVKRGTGDRPILVKTLKPYQDRRADLPVIGPETISECVRAGFKGIAIEANGTLVIDRESTIKAADSAELFLVAIECTRPETEGPAE